MTNVIVLNTTNINDDNITFDFVGYRSPDRIAGVLMRNQVTGTWVISNLAIALLQEDRDETYFGDILNAIAAIAVLRYHKADAADTITIAETDYTGEASYTRLPMDEGDRYVTYSTEYSNRFTRTRGSSEGLHALRWNLRYAYDRLVQTRCVLILNGDPIAP